MTTATDPAPGPPPRSAWRVPDPISVCEVGVADDTEIKVRQHGNADAPLRLILSHGNGLAVDLYYPFWSLLADEFELIVFDLRNHGWNRPGLRQHHNIPTLIRDHDLVLDAITRRYGAKPSVGVFHSLSTVIALLSETQRYSGLVLFEPPLCKPSASEAEFDAACERAAAMIRRRRERYGTEEEFAEMLAYLPGFLHVLPGVRQLMAETTLRHTGGDMPYELRCPREYEAQITEYLRSFAPLLDLEGLSAPTKVIGADPTLPFTYLPSFDLSRVTAVDYDFVVDGTHLLQLEKPMECVTMLRDFLDQIGLLQVDQPAPDAGPESEASP